MRPFTMMLAASILGFAAAPALAEARPDERVVFEDRFEGKLDEGWTWLREDEDKWRFNADGPGLEIRVVPGKADTVRNALLREAPDRDEAAYAFEVTVTNLQPPKQQWEQAGLTWYHDGRPVTKLVKELLDDEIIIFPGFQNVPDVPIRLRMEVRGDTYRSLFHPLPDEANDDHEQEFRLAGAGDLPPAGSATDHISLQCYDGPPDAEHWIRFTDFRIIRLAE